jgi:hypothetical protein
MEIDTKYTKYRGGKNIDDCIADNNGTFPIVRYGYFKRSTVGTVVTQQRKKTSDNRQEQGIILAERNRE